MVRVGRLLVTVIGFVGLTGCYDWVAIKPADIPRFTAGDRELERPGGDRVRFEGEVAVKVHTSNGTRTYWNPQANIADGALAISGDSAPPAQIPLTAIDRAKAGQLDTSYTIATIAVSLAAAATAFAFYKYTWFDTHPQQ